MKKIIKLEYTRLSLRWMGEGVDLSKLDGSRSRLGLVGWE